MRLSGCAGGIGELELGNEGRDGIEIEPSEPNDPRELCGGPVISNIS